MSDGSASGSRVIGDCPGWSGGGRLFAAEVVDGGVEGDAVGSV